MSQNIDKTFIGTSDPVTFTYSQSYYGPSAPSAEKTTISDDSILFDESKKYLLGEFKAYAKLGVTLTAGIALPSWALTSQAEGTLENDRMTLVVTEDNIMGGMLLGAMADVNFSVGNEAWVPGHMHWGFHSHWVSGYWNDTLSKSFNFKFDVLGTCVTLIYSLGKQIPGFKKLLALIPKGLLDDMQVFASGIADGDGVFLDPDIPMKWDLLYIARQLVEVGADVVSGPLIEVLAVITTVGEAMIDLEEEVGVCLGMGPEIDFVFPVKLKITELVADDVKFRDLTFDGATIIGENPDGVLDVDNNPVERIGFNCNAALDLMTLDLGFWSSITVLKVLSMSGRITINEHQRLMHLLGLNITLDSFNSSMTNTIGSPGADEFGDRVDTVEVKFI